MLVLLAGLTACGDGDYKRKYDNTLKSFEEGGEGGDQIKRRRDACLETLGRVKDADDLKSPRIFFAEWYHGGPQVFIFVDWVALRPMADGILLKSKKGVAKYTLPPDDIAANDEDSKDKLAFKTVVFYPSKEMPVLMGEGDLVVILTRKGREISQPVPLKRDVAPQRRKIR